MIPVFVIAGLIGGILATNSGEVELALNRLHNQTSLGYISENITNFITEQIWKIRYVDYLKNQTATGRADADNPFTHKDKRTVLSVTRFMLKIAGQLLSTTTDVKTKQTIFLTMVPESFIPAFIIVGCLAFIIYFAIGCLCVCGLFKRPLYRILTCCCCCCAGQKKGKTVTYERVTDTELRQLSRTKPQRHHLHH
jgi:hypothetical protein